MSCASLRHRFEEEKKAGLTFARALEIYRDVSGSVDAHRVELEELRVREGDPERVRYLQEHIAEGEKLLTEMRSLRLH